MGGDDASGCGKTIAIIGLIGSIVTIFVFLTGIVSLSQLFGRSDAPAGSANPAVATAISTPTSIPAPTRANDVATHIAPASTSNTSPDAVITNPPGLNLRDGPGTTYHSQGLYPQGTEIKIIGQNGTGDWLKVQTPDNRQGWMAISGLQVNIALADIAVAEAPASPTPKPQPPTAVPAAEPAAAETTNGPLEVGKAWSEANEELRLVETKPDSNKWLLVWFRLTNLSSQDKGFRYSFDNFSAVDNRGKAVQVGAVGNYTFSIDCPPKTVVLPANGDLDLIAGNCNIGMGWTVLHSIALPIDFGDTSLTEVTVTVSNLSGIKHASWRIPIGH